MEYDAILLLSFGGPDKPKDVLPFLENVCAGKPIPKARLEEVAERYLLFDGESPINAQNRSLLVSLVNELRRAGHSQAVYWGNLYWHPMLEDTVREMAGDGVRTALAFVTSAYGSPAGCRRYLDAIEAARAAVGEGAPRIDKIRNFFNHPGFVEAYTERVSKTLGQIDPARRDKAAVFFSAHSIPVAMAERCSYVAELTETCRLVAEAAGLLSWELAYQSRTGPPTQPWLEPELGERIVERIDAEEVSDVVVVPIGFVQEHMETVYDLDVEIAALCEHFGVGFHRVATPGTSPRFVAMVRALIEERLGESGERAVVGESPAGRDECGEGCCR